MKSCATLTLALMGIMSPRSVSSLAFASKRSSRTSFAKMSSSLGAGDEPDIPEPYFQMQQIPTATTGSRLERFVECAEEGGECDVTEMQEMIEELERLNLECQGTMSRECNLDTVAARNVLKVALASKVAIEGALSDPYLAMSQMHDECVYPIHQVPTATGNDIDHIIDCANGNECCNVEEMTQMIDELEEMNAECEGTLSRECNLEAVEARNLLKVALASQVAVEDAWSRKRK